MHKEKTYQIPESQLTEEQKAKLHTPTSTSTVRDWVGLGKEIGQAVDSSLSAISNQANEFAKTPVGKMTVFVVIFKVIGDTAVHIAGGIFEIIIFMPLWVWSYRRFLPKKILSKENLDATTGKVISREYVVLGYQGGKVEENIDNWRMAHWVVLAALGIIVLATVFTY